MSPTLCSDPTALARAVLLGTLDARAIDDVVTACWTAGSFRQQADAGALPAASPRGGGRRYAMCDDLAAALMYGAPGRPGCLWVHTPALGPWDGDLASLPVPLHAHDSAHVTVVTRGQPLFLCVRTVDGRRVLWTEALRPGAVVLYPAGVAHTFVGEHAFDVASLQARYHDPDSDAFALPARDIADLPRAAA